MMYSDFIATMLPNNSTFIQFCENAKNASIEELQEVLDRHLATKLIEPKSITALDEAKEAYVRFLINERTVK